MVALVIFHLNSIVAIIPDFQFKLKSADELVVELKNLITICKEGG